MLLLFPFVLHVRSLYLFHELLLLLYLFLVCQSLLIDNQRTILAELKQGLLHLSFSLSLIAHRLLLIALLHLQPQFLDGFIVHYPFHQLHGKAA